ncbi:hypothetical protein ABH923_003888 [Leifsonia sp. EB41]
MRDKETKPKTDKNQGDTERPREKNSGPMNPEPMHVGGAL